MEVTFAASDSSESMVVIVPVLDDEIFEAQEGFFARLSIQEINPEDIRLLEDSIRDTTLICISDNDGMLAISFSDWLIAYMHIPT